jgi:DNA-binding NtrC family response regulator
MKRERILVVDDEEIVRDIITVILDNDGFAALGVCGGAEALAELDKGFFRLVITDVMMPKMNGIELIAAVRDRWPKVETVVISGHGSEATKNKLDMLGVFGYLDKPIKAVDLVSIAREAVKGNRLERLGCGTADAQVILSRERVLIAVDDPVMQDVLHTALSSHGYNVTIVGKGEKTHELLLINDYNLVVLDIDMPGMNGIEAVRMIRKFDPYTCILLIGSESRKKEVENAMKNGADQFLAKPITSESIIGRIAKINFDRIRRQKRAHIVREKSDAGRRYGFFRRFSSVQFWKRSVRSFIVEFIAILVLGLLIGGIAFYLSGGKDQARNPDGSAMDKEKMIQEYIQSGGDIQEMKNKYDKLEK